MFVSLIATVSLALGALALPFDSAADRVSYVNRNGVDFTVFEHAATGARIDFVTNSGICETTRGVNQYSGYLSVGTGLNMVSFC
jgi:hypothetical protein